MRKPITTPTILRASRRIPATITGRCPLLGLVYALAEGDAWALVFDRETGRQVGGTARLEEGEREKK